MTTLRQSAEEALNALEFCAGTSYITDAHDIAEEAIIQLSKALAEPEPQRQWVGLTDDEIVEICADCSASAYRWDDINYARAIEAKLKEKNT